MRNITILTIVMLTIFTPLVLGFKRYTYAYKVYDDTVHVLKIAKNKEVNIEPYVSESLDSVSDILDKSASFAVINAGYFDPSNSQTISYVFKNGKIIADPNQNPNLMSSESLKPYLYKILNRSEFRVLNCGGNLVYDITFHNNDVPQDCMILHSIQAGPMLLPKMDLEKEFFVLKQNNQIIRQSAGVLLKTARTAIGYDNDYLYLILVKRKPGMTMSELSQFCKKLGITNAMAFDGGSSSSMYINFPEHKFSIDSAKDSQARQIKSALVVKIK